MVKYAIYNHPDEWLNRVNSERKDVVLLKAALQFYEAHDLDLLKKGVEIADVLFEINLDNESLAAAILYPLVQRESLHEAISEQFGESMRHLLDDALQMQSLGKLQYIKNPNQVENLRKLLLAIVTDVRAVLIVLAERLWQLRKAKHSETQAQIALAEETMAVFSPLANRLGVWQLKWEIEDLCLRYLKPEVYQEIAKWLASRREERELYIKNMIEILNTKLSRLHLKDFRITGRVKHIFSIYKKMERKGATIDQVYDVSALRVLVPTINDCYNVLGLVQSEWKNVPQEFDDYISQPKPNGYRSIHTVILGPLNRHIEIQIRTHQMHHDSELGVAAHWRYKENVAQVSDYETKIALLREVMAWQKDLISGNTEEKQIGQVINEILSDRIYVFTPLGDIIDLPKGATPIDFAYHIHSEIGHRCRGAKVNNSIVPLTYALQTGDKVEVITAKEANPSRDWINPQLGYLKTSKARAKAAHWFRLKDHTNEKEAPKPAQKINPLVPPPVYTPREKTHRPEEIEILGVNNLLTHVAGCCKPLPGDSVIGYITQNRGITIHRINCKNLNHHKATHRLITVDWQTQAKTTYPVDLLIQLEDRPGIVRDITTILSGEKLNLLGLKTLKPVNNTASIYLTLEIATIDELNKAMQSLKKIPSVLDIKRKN